MIGGVEHVGISMAMPMDVADWYRRVLGFNILVQRGANDQGMVFLRDGAGKTTFEFFANPDMAPLTGRIDNPLQLHLAFSSDAPEADAARLVEAGAKIVSIGAVSPEGEQLVALTDPWGNCVQFAKRAAGSPLV